MSCLVPVTTSTITADMTVWSTAIRYRLREWSLFQPERKVVILSSPTSCSCLIAIQKALRQRYPELQLSQLGVGALVVQDVSIHNRCVEEMEKNSLPPLDGSVCKPVVQDQLIG